MAARSELVCHHWLAKELVWWMEVVTVEPSNPGSPTEARRSEFTGGMNVYRLFGPGTALWLGEQSSMEKSELVYRPSTGRERFNSAHATAKIRAKQAKCSDQAS